MSVGPLTRIEIEVKADEVSIAVSERERDGEMHPRMGWTMPRSAWPDGVLESLRAPVW